MAQADETPEGVGIVEAEAAVPCGRGHADETDRERDAGEKRHGSEAGERSPSHGVGRG
jgi:hypothetical protein